jgi:hypothetical protein
LTISRHSEHGTVGDLVVQAQAHPVAFMSLLGKVLPMTIDSTGKGESVGVKIVEWRIVDPLNRDGERVPPASEERAV